MAITTGTRLGSYEIVAPLGAGRMGEVYRARDSRLKRDVAIKVLPDGFAFDASRLELSGDAFPIADRIAGNAGNGKLALAVSDAGIIAYRTGGSTFERQITWLDRAGHRVGTVGPVGDSRSLDLSADGKRLAVGRLISGKRSYLAAGFGARPADAIYVGCRDRHFTCVVTGRKSSHVRVPAQ